VYEQRVRLFFFGMPDQNILVDDLFRFDDPYCRQIHIAQALAYIAIVMKEDRPGDQRLDRFALDLPALTITVTDGYGYFVIKPDAAHQIFLCARRLHQFR